MSRVRWMLVAVLSALAFGMSGTFVKPVLDAGWSPGAGSIVRTGIGTLILAVPTIRALRGRWHLVARLWLPILLFGGIGIAGTQTAYFLAVSRIPVSTALMIEYLAPVLLVIATGVWLRRVPPVRVIAGALLAMAGLALVLDLGAGVALDPVGLTAAFVAAVVCAVYFQLSATLPLPPLALTGLGFAVATVVSAVLGVTGLVPVTVGGWTVELLGAHVSALVPLAVVVLIATALAYSIEVAAAAHVGARAASFLALTEVLFATAAAALVLGQLPGPMQAAGGVVLLAGVLLVVSAPTAHAVPRVHDEEPAVPAGEHVPVASQRPRVARPGRAAPARR
ncbi:EamA family transporter [Amnibacterium sp. CER49]|uniref:EamA family transporter n=1 Tax=Amnibacterium sp. CER49 TaxID=3039161 RepID=UPI00244C5A49|nr:EamA family transporter [Amnibacterium sp. CER49]MDH2445074.1 EamA family transporter [Amnibacterium sp. CER49]